MDGDDAFWGGLSGIMENNTETSRIQVKGLGLWRGLYWGYIGILEKKMANIILGFIGFRVQGVESFQA